MFIFSKLY